MAEKGGISVQTEHIFPIIKRWLYSDKEIFLRELVSNAADAETKLKHLVAVGQASGIEGDYRIDVTVNKEEKTINLIIYMDTELSSIMDYFDIYLSRMIMCEKAANFLGYRFELVINGAIINNQRARMAFSGGGKEVSED